MKTREIVLKEFRNVPGCQSQSNVEASRLVSKFGRQLKKTFYLAGLAGIIICTNACVSSGYVTTQPTYREYSRPPQPSNRHVWVSDGWGWNRPNQMYVQKNGYWKKPAQGRTYVSGNWKESPKGNSWKQGHWQKKNR